MTPENNKTKKDPIINVLQIANSTITRYLVERYNDPEIGGRKATRSFRDLEKCETYIEGYVNKGFTLTSEINMGELVLFGNGTLDVRHGGQSSYRQIESFGIRCEGGDGGDDFD